MTRTTISYFLINKGTALVRCAGPSFLRGLHFLVGFGAFFFILFFFKNKSNLAFQAWKSPPLHTLSASPVSGWLLSWVPAGSALGGAGAGKCLVLHPSDLLYIPVLCFTSHFLAPHLIPLLHMPFPCFISHALALHPMPLLHIPFPYFTSHSLASHPIPLLPSHSFAPHPTASRDLCLPFPPRYGAKGNPSPSLSLTRGDSVSERFNANKG